MRRKSEAAPEVSKFFVASATDLIPDDKLSIWDLIDRASEYSQDDPVHNKADLYQGIYTAHPGLDVPVGALALLYRRARAAFIMTLSRGRLSFDAIHMLRRLLHEIPGGKRHAEDHEKAGLWRARAELERDMRWYREVQWRERARHTQQLN